MSKELHVCLRTFALCKIFSSAGSMISVKRRSCKAFSGFEFDLPNEAAKALSSSRSLVTVSQLAFFFFEFVSLYTRKVPSVVRKD